MAEMQMPTATRGVSGGKCDNVVIGGRYRRRLLASLTLCLKGHRIVARGYKTPVGEVDLIALKGSRLAFVEVKRRRSFEDGAVVLPAKRRRRIVRAAQYWLSDHPSFTGRELAFDLILTTPFGWPRYIQNAFLVGMGA